MMAHEIMHCVLNHMRRGKGHDHEKSNIAADYEVNAWINDIGLIRSATMEKIGALYDKKYSGWGYEKIYADNPSGPKDSMGSYPFSGEIAAKVQHECFENKLVMEKGGRFGSVMRCLCALNISDEDLNHGLDIFEKVVLQIDAEITGK